MPEIEGQPTVAEQLDELHSATDLPDTLFHYTDINGLQGIWENGELWATQSQFLNDTSEIQLGTLVIHNAVADRQIELLDQMANLQTRQLELQEAGKESDLEAVQRELAQLRPQLKEAEHIRESLDYVEDLDIFVTCLTENGDQLSQWRGYAREGYCIGLKTSALLANINEDDKKDSVIRRVRYYDNEANAEYVKKTIDTVRQIRSYLLEHPTPDNDDDDLNKYIIGKFALLDAAFIKDTNFAEEAEVRIVITGDKPTKHTPHRYGMVPRIQIPIPREAVESVRVGPSAHAKLKKKSLQSYFWNVGFKREPVPPAGERVTVPVNISRIPFRDW